MFIGNAGAVNFFDQAIANDRLGQVYCFSGPEQVGKRTLALSLSARLLRTAPEKLSIHPDFFFLERGVDEKTGKARKEISVNQARQLRSFLQNQSWQGDRKAVVIEEAETLNEESSNALLKSLEEASGKTVIFLVTGNDDLLLPTIKSRVQMFSFSFTADEEIVGALKEKGCDEEKASECAYYASGRPGRAVAFWETPEELSEWKTETYRWRELWAKPLYLRFKELENFFKGKEELVRVQDRLARVLNIWTEEGRRMMLGYVDKLDKEKTKVLAKVLDGLQEAEMLLGQNINPKMLLEKIMLQF